MPPSPKIVLKGCSTIFKEECNQGMIDSKGVMLIANLDGVGKKKCPTCLDINKFRRKRDLDYYNDALAQTNRNRAMEARDKLLTDLDERADSKLPKNRIRKKTARRYLSLVTCACVDDVSLCKG